MRNVNTLVTVTGHASYLDTVERTPDDPMNEEHWYLQEFQKGEVPFYINHMRRGAELVAANRDSIGVMSGGRTRLESGRWSEASSYLATADAYDFWQEPGGANAADVGDRFYAEEFARDSLENVLYSVLTYRRTIGRMPLQVAMVGWEIKELRFKHHARTLGIPDEVFEYIGAPLDAYGCTAMPPDENQFGPGEQKAYRQWLATPLGDCGPLLRKRDGRNPFLVTPPYTWAEYVGHAHEAGWQPSLEVLAAAALEGATAV